MPTQTPTQTPTSTATVEPTPTTEPTATPVTATVRINELLPVPGETDWDGNGVADELDEWIELYNAGTMAIDISGWSLQGGEGEVASYPLPEGTALEPGAFLVLYWQQTGITLEDSGDSVRLIAPDRVVDEVTFGALAAGASYNRGETGAWYASPLPSPGQANVPPAE